jgi:glutamate racemase
MLDSSSLKAYIKSTRLAARMNIGVFDSGLGGLSILKEIIDVLPDYNYVYLADNARVPYGGRSPELIYQFTKRSVNFLMQKKDCLLVVLACNTATATALRKIQREYLPSRFPERRVLGVIRPAVEAAVENRAKKVGLIGTEATIASNSFCVELKKLSPSIEVYQQPCPLLVPIIEEGETEWEGLSSILSKYLRPLKEREVDTLILGCTHYSLVADKIRSFMGGETRIISEATVVARKLKSYLDRHPEIEKRLTKGKKRTYFVTDLNDRYRRLAQLFMGGTFRRRDHLKLVEL